LSLVAFAATTWPTTPALAGFTPTPANTPVPTSTPVPTNTPIHTPTHTPPPTLPPTPPPQKQPKDTPVPTATIDLTATPAELPITGGPADETGIRIVLIAGMIVLTMMSVAVVRLAGSSK
jgi:outer membrane biosynthesis protein TonB